MLMETENSYVNYYALNPTGLGLNRQVRSQSGDDRVCHQGVLEEHVVLLKTSQQNKQCADTV